MASMTQEQYAARERESVRRLIQALEDSAGRDDAQRATAQQIELALHEAAIKRSRATKVYVLEGK